MSAIQVMPPLTRDENESLRDDIVERGVVAPVVVDQHVRLLDGGVDCPVEATRIADDENARTVTFKWLMAQAVSS